MTENRALDEESFQEDEVDLEEEDDTLAYFGGLFRREENERSTFMENFNRSSKGWLAKPDDLTAQRLLKVHLPTALRLSVNCPFRDVRTGMSKLLEELEELGCEIPKSVLEGPSSFVPVSETVSYSNASRNDVYTQALAKVQALYEEAFIQQGRLPHLLQLLGYHPSYLSIFIKTHDFLMLDNGPLPLHIRNYIAILAASRHKCSYLVTIQEAEFLKNGGDLRWLMGINHLPTKMLVLLPINKILAHQPWFVRPEHMKELLRGADSWSVSELVHVIAIMAHFHALAGFSLGCGVNPEMDTPSGHIKAQQNGTEHCMPHFALCGNPSLGMGATPSDSELSDSAPISPRSPMQAGMSESIVEHYIDSISGRTVGDIKLADSLTEKLKTMEHEVSDEDPDDDNNQYFAESASSAGMDRPKRLVPTPVNLVKYLEDPDYEHEDFTLSSAITLRARDYSWEDHGFPYLNSLYAGMGPLLDEKFKMSLQMTYNTCGAEKNIDTSPFREAVWYYIHSIKGIRHDDYVYRRVNQILDITFKTYIRMVGCFPEKTTRFDFENCITALDHSEKVHVNILVLEARQQAELIYALRAILTYMK